MVRRSSEIKLDYLDNVYLEKEIEKTFFPKGERYSLSQPDGGSAGFMTLKPDSMPNRHRDGFFTLDEAVLMNINNTLNNSNFSIYGGSNNGIWSSKPASWHRQTPRSSVASWSDLGVNQNSHFAPVERPSHPPLGEDYPFFYGDTPRLGKQNLLATLACPSVTGSSLTGRLIEDTLKIPLKPMGQRAPPRQGNPHSQDYLLAPGLDPKAAWRYCKDHKSVNQTEMKLMNEIQRKDSKRAEKKIPPSVRGNKAASDAGVKGSRPEQITEFTEAGSLRNVLEASEIWLRNTTTSNFSNKKQILKKHFINETQFYVGVS